jgi:hypothetical protein
MNRDARKVITPRFDIGELATAEPWVPAFAWECQALVSAIRFDASALPVDDIVFAASVPGVTLIIDFLAPDRDTRGTTLDWIHIWRTLLCPWEPLKSNGPEYLIRWMRETIANTMAHEVDESISIAGQRVFDPHRKLLVTA